MEQNRIYIFLALCFVSYMMYDAWVREHAPKTPMVNTTQPSTATPGAGDSTTLPGSTNDMPLLAASKPATASLTNVTAAPGSKLAGERISVYTDVYHVEIDTLGGDLRKVDLLKYPVSIVAKDQPFKLMDDSPQRFFVAQSGWHLPQNPSQVPGTKTIYQVAKKEYRLLDGEKSVRVELQWQNADGVEFTKGYVFQRGSYEIELEHSINNTSAKELQTNLFLRLQRNAPEESSGFMMMPVSVGPVYYSPDQKYKKYKFADIDKTDASSGGVKDVIKREIAGGWAGMIEQFFVAAWLPAKEDSYRYFTSKMDDASNHYLIGMMKAETVAAKEQQHKTSARLYVGPKIQKHLADVAPGLELSVDYGWLTFISKPLFWVMDQINTFVGNWGWSIILLTIAIKLVFYKLSEASYRSMAKMKSVTPRMMALKERYGDDKQKMNQALMDMYKKEKINPVGGCLPILIQIPVFIALYYVLLESVELRQTPWVLWIHDLSIMDPYFILPIIMGVTMMIQQRLNPTPMDPMQAKIMMVLPVIFTVMFAVFPAGLVLYWVVNNTLSIAQQWYITKHVLAEEKHTAGHHSHKKE
jgi:YidC/Oxa1 family membrane protein insertase